MQAIFCSIAILLYIPFTVNCQNINKYSTIESTIEELLKFGKENENAERDLCEFRNIFTNMVRFSMVNEADSGHPSFESVSLDDFLELLEDDYYDTYKEISTGQIVNEFNGIANVFQSFEGWSEGKLEGTGVTSYHLVYSEGRWWVSDVLWTIGEDIPDKYLNR